MLSLEDESGIQARGEGKCRDGAQDPGHTEDGIALVVVRHAIATCVQGFLDASADLLPPAPTRQQIEESRGL